MNNFIVNSDLYRLSGLLLGFDSDGNGISKENTYIQYMHIIEDFVNHNNNNNFIHTHKHLNLTMNVKEYKQEKRFHTTHS